MYFMNSRIDHIVIGAANLISGTKILETKLSTKFSPGGEHMIMGTHNKLLKLQSNIYLEVIANNPNVSKPSRQRWFSLDESSIKEKIKKFAINSYICMGLYYLCYNSNASYISYNYLLASNCYKC